MLLFAANNMRWGREASGEWEVSPVLATGLNGAPRRGQEEGAWQLSGEPACPTGPLCIYRAPTVCRAPAVHEAPSWSLQRRWAVPGEARGLGREGKQDSGHSRGGAGRAAGGAPGVQAFHRQVCWGARLAAGGMAGQVGGERAAALQDPTVWPPQVARDVSGVVGSGRSESLDQRLSTRG